jgi:hypothetical protein
MLAGARQIREVWWGGYHVIVLMVDNAKISVADACMLTQSVFKYLQVQLIQGAFRHRRVVRSRRPSKFLAAPMVRRSDMIFSMKMVLKTQKVAGNRGSRL